MAKLPRFKRDALPEYTEYELAKSVIRGALEYFEKPGVAEQFEKWKQEREARLAAEAGKEAQA